MTAASLCREAVVKQECIKIKVKVGVSHPVQQPRSY